MDSYIFVNPSAPETSDYFVRFELLIAVSYEEYPFLGCDAV
jgi:hypothetical protein